MGLIDRVNGETVTYIYLTRGVELIGANADWQWGFAAGNVRVTPGIVVVPLRLDHAAPAMTP
jgi:hypothetical protein